MKTKPQKRTEIPYYHRRRPLEKPGKITLVQGEHITFPDGRDIAAFRVLDAPGIFVKIGSPLGKTKTSMLKFRITDEAALALIELLMSKLCVRWKQKP